jgi:hypothetical protein
VVASPRQLAVSNAAGALQLQVPAHTPQQVQAELVEMSSRRVTLNDEAAQPARMVLAG